MWTTRSLTGLMPQLLANTWDTGAVVAVTPIAVVVVMIVTTIIASAIPTVVATVIVVTAAATVIVIVASANPTTAAVAAATTGTTEKGIPTGGTRTGVTAGALRHPAVAIHPSTEGAGATPGAHPAAAARRVLGTTKHLRQARQCLLPTGLNHVGKEVGVV